MLNEERIKEVMRLADEVSGAVGELACSTNESETYESIDAARAALVSYLRTIGEPETAGAATRQVKVLDPRNPRYNNARSLAVGEFMRSTRMGGGAPKP